MFRTLLSRKLPTTRAPLRLSFSLGSIMVITVVVAFLGVALGQLYRSLVDPTPDNVAYFALAASVGPSAILIVAGTAFKLLRWLKQPLATDHNGG